MIHSGEGADPPDEGRKRATASNPENGMWLQDDFSKLGGSDITQSVIKWVGIPMDLLIPTRNPSCNCQCPTTSICYKSKQFSRREGKKWTPCFTET